MLFVNILVYKVCNIYFCGHLAYNTRMSEISTRRQILTLLRTQGAQTALQLADQLKVTSMGIRRHLTLLERDELVHVETVRRAVGRPTFLYALTEQGRETFPKSYDVLALQLLDALRISEGDARVSRIFAGRMDELYRQFSPRMNGKNLAERVAELAQIQAESGYMAQWERVPGGYLLREQNCAIYRVACRFQAACHFEIELFRRLLETDIERVEHQVSGALACTYFITDSSRKTAPHPNKRTPSPRTSRAARHKQS